MKSALAAAVAVAVVFVSGGIAKAEDDLRADSVNIFFDPDVVSPGTTLLEHYSSRQYVYMYREIVPVEVGAYTYFAILGANGGYPDFYGGIQHFKDGSKAAIFSAWDVGSDGACWNCLPGTGDPEKQVSVFAKGPRTVTRPFGYEGTGMNSMIHGFDWKLNQKVSMLASVEPSGKGSLISAAIKNGNEPWEFIASFYVPTKYPMGMPGGYSFAEDWVPGDSTLRRSYLAGPSYLVDNSGRGVHYTNVFVSPNNPTGDGVANMHTVEVQGEWLKVTIGLPVQPNALPEQRLQLRKPSTQPDISAGITLLESIVGEKSDRIRENKRVAAERAAAEAAAAAAAAAAPKPTTITCLRGKERRVVRAVNPRCPAGFQIQRTIVCVKGKEIQRVSGVNPRCPTGFRKR